MVAIFAILYLGVNFKKLKETRVKTGLVLNIAFILAVSSFFWVPLIETKFYTDYQVYEDGMMATAENTAAHGLNFTQLFVTKNDGSYVFELGPQIIVMVAFSIMAIRRMKEDDRENFGFFLIVTVISLWLTTKYFPWKLLPNKLCIVQFPWRFLMISGFFLSAVCSLTVFKLVKKFGIKDVAIISLVSILYLVIFIGNIPQDEGIEDITNYTLGQISGSEFETVAGTAKAEYLPVKAYNNRFYIATREKALYVLNGKALIENENKNGSEFSADIKTLDSKYTIFELPYIYYPGYEVRLDGMIIDTFETENGFIGFAMSDTDTAHLEVNYVGTRLMKISLVISIISCFAFMIYVWKKH